MVLFAGQKNSLFLFLEKDDFSPYVESLDGTPMDTLTLIAQSNGGGGNGIVGVILLVLLLAIALAVVVGGCRIFQKAGQPGLGFLIPIYNIYLLIQIADRPAWWLILTFIPLVNLIIASIIWKDIAENFGKGIGFALGLILLGPIFIPILGFGSAEYQPK